MTARPDYGLDAPGIVRGFLLGGPLLAVAGLAPLLLTIGWPTALGNTALAMGVVFTVQGALMVWSSRRGKLRAADRLLDGLGLRGDETVLDVGCGRDLLLIGAATRLPRGRAVGLDLWSQVDLGDNRREATLQNAAVAGVAERVEVHDGDMRTMPFADASFDAAVASLSIHNIYNAEGRRQAIAEIVRVLKPGGKVALMDIRHVGEYADALRAAGVQDVRVSGLIFWIFPPVRVGTGHASKG